MGFLVANVYLQYLLWGKNHKHRILGFKKHFYSIAVGTLVVMSFLAWEYIIFYQDYYVNTACALWAVLPMSAGYFFSLYTRPQLRGLSVVVAWCLTIGTALLYIAIVLGDMTDPFPRHEDTGYTFIYGIFALTIFLNVWYSVLLTKRREELKPDWDPEITLRRMHGLRDDGTLSQEV